MASAAGRAKQDVLRCGAGTDQADELACARREDSDLRAIAVSHPDTCTPRRKGKIVGAAERVDMAAQARTCRIRNVHDRDRPGSLAERDPEPVARPVFCHVMGSVPDVDAACHPPPCEVDHDELPAGVVGDVREASVSADQGDVRRAEAPQHFHDPQTAEVDESHGRSPGADDHRGPIGRFDILRVRRHAQAFDDPAVRKRDGEKLVRRLRRNERDRSPASLGPGLGRRREQRCRGKDWQDAFHANWYAPRSGFRPEGDNPRVDERQRRAVEALQNETTLPGLLHAATREFVEVVDGVACAISRVVGDVLIQVAEHSRDGRTLVLGHGYLISDFPLTDSALREGRPQLVSLLDPDPDPREGVLLGELDLDSLLMIPLPGPSGPWGLAEIYVNGRRFDEEDVARAEPVAATFGERLVALPVPASAR